jgi:hypothetical protein
MTDLVDAYQRREVHTAEKILKGNRVFFPILMFHVMFPQITTQRSWTTISSGRILANFSVVYARNI